MSTERTTQVLAAITDEGFFELLAMAILREADPIYRTLIHPGVNVKGKTIKSPVDGICFVQGSTPPHMIVVHHTITARSDLENKWLHDPSKVKPQKDSRPRAPAGDLIKTAKLVAQERKHTPNLRVTLVLTTNQEPPDSLVRKVVGAGRIYDLEIDIWSCSRLSHFLDNNPSGQWIRYSFLNIDQEMFSAELLQALSNKSIDNYTLNLLDNPEAWVPRVLDDMLTTRQRLGVTFLVARSGFGKSVACYKRLMTHVKGGGVGIILSHDIISSAVTLEQAIITALQKLHPSLSTVGPSVFSFCSSDKPLLLVVEDINRSGQTQLLVEKILGWSRKLTNNKSSPSPWCLLCPLWPEVLTSLSEQAKETINPLIIIADRFTDKEGCNAVIAREWLFNCDISILRAKEISNLLGHDPLLIALHDPSKEPDPHHVISQFVEGSLSRVAIDEKENTVTDYRDAICDLAGEMLSKRQIDPNWREVRKWGGLLGEPLRIISRIAKYGELIRFTGPSNNQKLSFRHDRVRDWLLADAASELDRRGLLAEDIVSDPYFAEVMGAVLVKGSPDASFLQRVSSSNPLALFHALRLIGPVHTPHLEAILQSIYRWLDNPATQDPSNYHLRREALAMLAGTDSLEVPKLVRKFNDQTISSYLALLRNGIVTGGIELCTRIEPGDSAPWRDIQIEHAKINYGQKLSNDLDVFLRRTDLDKTIRKGALRFAGHIAEPSLALAIEACWTADEKHNEYLADYLWAFGECCSNDPVRYLKPVCDAWANLSDQPEKDGWPSPRDNLAAHELRWAFHKWPPIAALDYLIERGSQDDLRWPITYMLHGMDHPKAILFVVKELAARQRRLTGTNSFVMTARDEWKRDQELFGRQMSKESRDILLEFWQDKTKDKYLRTQAFSLWSANIGINDIEILRDSNSSVELADKILFERLVRGDQLAIPAMIDKLTTDEHGYWWQCGRYIWSPELTGVLDKYFEKRGTKSKKIWFETFGTDWIIHEFITRLPENQAEHLLLKHWPHLRYIQEYVQAALYVSTQSLLDAAQSTINDCPDPAKLLKHLCHHYGIRTKGRIGLKREAQVRALAPYLHLLAPIDIGDLWKECNDHGWFTVRKELLDNRLQGQFLKRKWDRDLVMEELDQMVTENSIARVNYWIGDFLKADVPWREILSTMEVWLDYKRSFNALRVVASVVERRGIRGDLKVLKVYDGMPKIEAEQLIVDTKFAVYRRSIY